MVRRFKFSSTLLLWILTAVCATILCYIIALSYSNSILFSVLISIGGIALLAILFILRKKTILNNERIAAHQRLLLVLPYLESQAKEALNIKIGEQNNIKSEENKIIIKLIDIDKLEAVNLIQTPKKITLEEYETNNYSFLFTLLTDYPKSLRSIQRQCQHMTRIACEHERIGDCIMFINSSNNQEQKKKTLAEIIEQEISKYRG